MQKNDRSLHLDEKQIDHILETQHFRYNHVLNIMFRCGDKYFHFYYNQRQKIHFWLQVANMRLHSFVGHYKENQIYS